MTDRKLFHTVLRALGEVKVGSGTQALEDQLVTLYEVISQLNEIKRDVANKHRVAIAEETRGQRLKPGDPSYWTHMTHMTHCYGLDYDDVIGDEMPTERYSCKVW